VITGTWEVESVPDVEAEAVESAEGDSVSVRGNGDSVRARLAAALSVAVLETESEGLGGNSCCHGDSDRV